MPQRIESKWERLVDRALSKELEIKKQEAIQSMPCTHPPHCVVEGRNQYGMWHRCLRCRTKIDYTPFSSKQDKKKKGQSVVYVPASTMQDTKKAAAYLREQEKKHAPAPSMDISEAASSSNQDIQQALVQSNQQLLTGLSSVLSQAVTPLMTGQQAILDLTQQSLASQAMMMQTVQQGQENMAGVMTQMIAQLRVPQDDEDWDAIPHQQNP